jgi:hypothetical protein
MAIPSTQSAQRRRDVRRVGRQSFQRVACKPTLPARGLLPP